MPFYSTEFFVPSEPAHLELWFEDQGAPAFFTESLEDSGTHAIFTGAVFEGDQTTGGDECFFVELHSTDLDEKHTLFRSFMGRRIRVTVETLD